MQYEELFRLMMYAISGLFSALVGIIIYYLKKMVEKVEFLGDGQDEIKSSLVRIETDMVNIKNNYSNLSAKTEGLSMTVNEHSVKIAKLEARVENQNHKESA